MNAAPLVALVGNPNAGKSALFNALTGARQKVGNYPGVTVERHSGRLTLDDGRPAMRGVLRALAGFATSEAIPSGPSAHRGRAVSRRARDSDFAATVGRSRNSLFASDA